MPKKETSAEISSLASNIMRRQPLRGPMIDAATYDDLLSDAKRLAASAMSQDESKGQTE